MFVSVFPLASPGWRGTRMMFLASALLASALLAPVAQAQNEPGMAAPGTWQSYPAMRQVQALASGGGELWAGTDGGVYRFDPATGEIRRFTTVEGLTNLDVRTLAFDELRGAVWVGYPDGVLDRIDVASGEVRTFFDIARADRYAQRGINRVRPLGDSLLVATDFGVVVFDVPRGEVRDTYDKFGALERGRRTYDIISAPAPDGTPGFWVATQDGVVWARRDAPNLRVPSAWTLDEGSPAPALVLANFAGRLYAGRERLTSPAGQQTQPGDVFDRQPGGGWQRRFATDWSVFDLAATPDRLIGITWFSVVSFDAAHARRITPVQDVFRMESGTVGPDGRLWVGSLIYGLGRLPELPGSEGVQVSPESFVVPDGPVSNRIQSLDVGRSGEVWVGFRPFAGVINGMGRFNGTGWANYGTLSGTDAAQGTIFAVKVDRRGMAWGGSEGDGVMRVTADGEVTVFRSDNSTLRGEPGFPSYVVTIGIDEDLDGSIWVTNRAAGDALHRWTPDDGWTGYSRPPGTPGIANRFRGIYIDRFGQKWISLLNSTQPRGEGFLVVRTGDAADPADDQAVGVTGSGSAATGTGLTDANVRAFAHDLDGRVWIGTERGLSVVFSPGSIFGNPALAVPSWARTPDQASYFLRDLNVYALAVDPAGRKWIGSSDGAWLINAEGNEVLAQFTPENSPLPSAAVLDIAVDGASGVVYMVTDAGLVSFRGDSVAPASRAQPLMVAPSPFRPAEHGFVRFEGLVAETRVRILTVDGQVVASFDARGGSATWDGRDARTGQLVPSGVYLVAAAGRDGEGAAYGKIAVIR
jgi:hypothetical protein